jgi:hypothetical protein
MNEELELAIERLAIGLELQRQEVKLLTEVVSISLQKIPTQTEILTINRQLKELERRIDLRYDDLGATIKNISNQSEDKFKSLQHQARDLEQQQLGIYSNVKQLNSSLTGFFSFKFFIAYLGVVSMLAMIVTAIGVRLFLPSAFGDILKQSTTSSVQGSQPSKKATQNSTPSKKRSTDRG